MSDKQPTTSPGAQAYADYWARQLADPAFRAIDAEEAAKQELWLQLVEARQDAGLSREELAQRLGIAPQEVERIEAGGYDAYPLTTLRRYVRALGDDDALVVAVLHREGRPQPGTVAG